MRNVTLLCLIALCSTLTGWSQSVTLPPSGGNQKSIVTQYIGSLAHVTIVYNSPDVTAPNGDDRKGQIWGQLVPYGLAPNNFGSAAEIPWRAGANENTVFKFSHDVEVEGKSLKAGKYSFHIIPKENEPWTLIFNKNSTAWGSYFYDQAEDALRVEVTPEENEYREWLTFEFLDRQPESATVALMWENLKVPFTITVPKAKELYVQNMERELENTAGFNYQSWVNAANFAVQNDVALDKALVWADKAISEPFIGVENFTTLSTKSQVLAKLGQEEEALATMERAIKHPTASSFQIHGFGRQLIAQDKKKKAMEVFEYNYKQNDGAWPTHVGMARGYSAIGEYDKALEHAKLALEQAPDQLNKDNLTQAVERLKNKEDIN